MFSDYVAPLGEHLLPLQYHYRSFVSLYQYYRYLISGIEEFHRKYVLVPEDKAANNVVVV